jgi:thioredoxin reductase (NADPH)
MADAVIVREREFDATDPYERASQTFPTLSAEMAARVASYGKEEWLPARTLVFERGQRSVDFFFILDGNIEIFDLDKFGAPNVFTVHAARQFTGELDLFNDRQILVSGRTGVDSRVVRIPRAAFRRLVAAEPDIGEIIMRAFILAPRRADPARAGRGGADRLRPRSRYAAPAAVPDPQRLSAPAARCGPGFGCGRVPGVLRNHP